MVRRKARSRRRRARPSTTSRQNNMNTKIRVRGRVLVDMSYSASFSFNALLMEPSNFSRLVDLCKVYEVYKWNQVTVRGLPRASAGDVAVGAAIGQSVASPASWTVYNVADLDPSVMVYAAQTTPVSFTIPRAKIHRDKQWFGTNNSTGAGWWLLVGGPASTAVTALIDIIYDITFDIPMSENKEFVIVPDRTRLSNEQWMERANPPTQRVFGPNNERKNVEPPRTPSERSELVAQRGALCEMDYGLGIRAVDETGPVTYPRAGPRPGKG